MDNTHSSYNPSGDSGMVRKIKKSLSKFIRYTTIQVSTTVKLHIEKDSMDYRAKEGITVRESEDRALRRIFGLKSPEEEIKDMEDKQ